MLRSKDNGSGSLKQIKNLKVAHMSFVMRNSYCHVD